MDRSEGFWQLAWATAAKHRFMRRTIGACEQLRGVRGCLTVRAKRSQPATAAGGCCTSFPGAGRRAALHMSNHTSQSAWGFCR